ncbi:MAG: insulinase family protein [Thermoplasmata archaeon]|nr:insulinase family protein [Thermoplasmata archaeon]
MLAVLLPIIESHEKASGISHIIEHLTILKSRNEIVLNGCTTEDYIFFFSNESSYGRVLDLVQNQWLNRSELEIAKRSVVAEIRRKRRETGEIFFSKVWSGTPYENSPMGTIRSIKSISLDSIKRYLEDLSRKPVYVLTQGNRVLIHGDPSNVHNEARNKLKISRTGRFNYKGNSYRTIYFTNDNETLFLIEHMLFQNNPKKLIQLCEKKSMSALILEEGIVFPKIDELQILKKGALKEIRNIFRKTESNFIERALNRLESMYFQNVPWEKRMKYLFQLPNDQLFNTMRLLQASINRGSC